MNTLRPQAVFRDNDQILSIVFTAPGDGKSDIHVPSKRRTFQSFKLLYQGKGGCPTRRCSRRFGLSRAVQGTARAIPPRG